jgi:hypothetical protein
MKTLLIYLFFLPCIVPVSGTNDWMLKKEKDGITISSRHSDLSKFNDLKIEMDLPGTLSQLSSILLDVEKYPQWAYCTKSSVAIKKISENEIIYYSEIEAPWPASNRDFYADMKVTFSADSQSLNVVSNGMKNYQPQKENLVRVPMSKAVWNISTGSDKTMHLQYILQVDPGGSIPAWILNIFATKGPLETFKNLKEKMELLNK